MSSNCAAGDSARTSIGWSAAKAGAKAAAARMPVSKSVLFMMSIPVVDLRRFWKSTTLFTAPHAVPGRGLSTPPDLETRVAVAVLHRNTHDDGFVPLERLENEFLDQRPELVSRIGRRSNSLRHDPADAAVRLHFQQEDRIARLHPQVGAGDLPGPRLDLQFWRRFATVAARRITARVLFPHRSKGLSVPRQVIVQQPV